MQQRRAARAARRRRRRRRRSPPCSAGRSASDRPAPASSSLSPFSASQVDRHADAAGDRGQVDDRVGRAADAPAARAARSRPTSGVMICAGVTRARASATARSPVASARAQPIGVHGRESRRCRAAPSRAPRRAGHRAGRAHDGAGARRGREVALDPLDLLARRRRRRGSAPRSAGNRCRRRAARRGARPVIIGPATSWIAGTPADAAPMSCAGTVLSQPPTSTTASIGWARIISSTSIDIRLRNIMLVGLEEHLAERDRREIERQAAGRQHAALHRVDQLGEVAVAVVEAAGGVRDADDRPGQHLASNSPWSWRTSGADRGRTRGSP